MTRLRLRPSESISLAAQAVPTTVPIIAAVVPAPTASQFSEELEEIRVAESLMSLQEGPSTAQRSYVLEIIHETPYSDLEVVHTTDCISKNASLRVERKMQARHFSLRINMMLINCGIWITRTYHTGML